MACLKVHDVAQAVQLDRERELRRQFDDDSGIQRALRAFRERTSGYGFGPRRSLLTNALRLTRAMSPDVADAVSTCRERIGFDAALEIYVTPHPQLNAFCLSDPTGLVVVGLSSRLLETFSPAELRFVIGHELGHAIYDHFALPMPHLAQIRDLAGPMVSRPTSITLFTWARAAELSADRIGLLCAEDADAAVTSFFKLASGVTSNRIRPDLDAFTAQVDSLASTPEARPHAHQPDHSLGCFSTHPYSPVRVRAMLAFSDSQLYQRAIGAPAGGLTDADLAGIIDHDLRHMSPTYLYEKTAVSELMRTVLYHAGVIVAAADDVIEETELDALRALLGADRVCDNTSIDSLDESVRALNDRVDELNRLASPIDRARLVQHLTIIAACDGDVSEREIEAMAGIANQLGVEPRIIDETLAGAMQPID